MGPVLRADQSVLRNFKDRQPGELVKDHLVADLSYVADACVPDRFREYEGL
jgi:hypothetical protein